MENMKITINFYGRQAGAIGIRYDISDTYKVESISEAKSKFYTDYDSLKIHSIKGCTLDQFDKAKIIEVRPNSQRLRQSDNATYVKPEKLR